MAGYFARRCPRCKHYLGLTMRDSPVKRPVQALNGQCLACGYWFAWIVISGKSDDEVANDGKSQKVSREELMVHWR